MISEFARFSLDVLKLAPRYLASVALICAALLFFPDDWKKVIGVESFAVENRQWLGLAFLVSGVLWLVSTSAILWSWINGKFGERGIQKLVELKLSSLTEDEKQILRYYFARDTRANVLRIDDGVVQGLVAHRVIYRSASVGNLVEGFAHNITNEAWDYILANPHVLQGSTNTYRTDRRERGW